MSPQIKGIVYALKTEEERALDLLVEEAMRKIASGELEGKKPAQVVWT